MNTTLEEKKATKELVEKCRVYLNDNFHKFKEFNKIKIALAILSKAMPIQLEHSGEIAGKETKIIIITNGRINQGSTETVSREIPVIH